MNKTIGEIEKAYNAKFVAPDNYTPVEEINAFDFLKTPVITESRSEIDLFQWGLIPFWAKDDKIKKMTLNAKVETANQKPAFKDAVQNRCLVLANAYFEWQWLDSKGKEKQKYRISPKDQEIFAFAGIYASWKDPASGIQINSYSILTTDANELMSEIHNHKKRMPIILKEKDRENWLAGKDPSAFAFPYEVPLQAKPVE